MEPGQSDIHIEHPKNVPDLDLTTVYGVKDANQSS